MPEQKPLVYLAGPIAGCNQEQMSTWRDAAAWHLRPSYDCSSPVHRLGLDPHTIVNDDLRDIERCQLVLAYLPKEFDCVGTGMEIFYASRILRRKVIAFGTRIMDIGTSPWYVEHTWKRFSLFDEAISYLMQDFEL